MPPFICLNPFNSGEWWEVSGNTRRLCSTSQKNTLIFLGANPAVLPADWFLSYPVATG